MSAALDDKTAVKAIPLS
ncbi:hypothetical protein A2U01_0075481, partial [Trifolium medium]|nr:hypothetical protein [Trifolium medium]